MSDSSARVYRLDPGSVVILENVHASPAMVENLTAELERRVGHREFVVLSLPAEGHAEVIPAAGLLAWLAAQGIALDQAGPEPVLLDHRPV